MPKAWQPSDGTNPYGKPASKGNADELWAKLNDVPCKCGATEKHVRIEGKNATIICGPDKLT